jgi:hypothetical protein
MHVNTRNTCDQGNTVCPKIALVDKDLQTLLESGIPHVVTRRATLGDDKTMLMMTMIVLMIKLMMLMMKLTIITGFIITIVTGLTITIIVEIITIITIVITIVIAMISVISMIFMGQVNRQIPSEAGGAKRAATMCRRTLPTTALCELTSTSWWTLILALASQRWSGLCERCR